jgi:hypothetical protein
MTDGPTVGTLVDSQARYSALSVGLDAPFLGEMNASGVEDPDQRT